MKHARRPRRLLSRSLVAGCSILVAVLLVTGFTGLARSGPGAKYSNVTADMARDDSADARSPVQERVADRSSAPQASGQNASDSQADQKLPKPQSIASRLADARASSAISIDDWALAVARTLAAPGEVPPEYRARAGDLPSDGTALLSELSDAFPALSPSTQHVVAALGFESTGGMLHLAGPLVPVTGCVKSTTHFDLHWDSATVGGGPDCTTIPQYVTDTAIQIEAVWQAEVVNFGWTAPPADASPTAPGCSQTYSVSPRYDFFVSGTSFSPGVFGLTSSSCAAQQGTGSFGDNENSPTRTEANAYASYIELSPDPVGQLGITITIASYLDQVVSHEFNHAIQFGHTILGGSWANEATAQWMMTQVNPATPNWFWDPHLIQHFDLELTKTSGPAGEAPLHNYASWLFLQQLSEHHGGQAMVRKIWEELALNPNLAGALSTAFTAAGTTVDDVYRELAIAARIASPNVANGIYSMALSSSWIPGFKEVGVEGGLVFNGSPPPQYDSTFSSNGNHRLDRHGTDFIAITDTNGIPFKVCVSPANDSTPTMAVSLVKQKQGSDIASVTPLVGTPPCAEITDAPAWDTFTLVISYLGTAGQSRLDYYISVGSAQTPGPSTDWYFAEGYTGAGFQEYLDIQNPGDAAATVNIEYDLKGGAVITKTIGIPSKWRSTINVNDGFTLGVGPGQEVSIHVTSDQPVVAERPMYFNYGGSWGGGHIAIGANAPNANWYFAEGYTAAGFDEYLTLQNPSAVTATATINYQLDTGPMAPILMTLPPKSRSTRTVFNGSTDVGRGHEVSTKITSTAPIVAERPMYFNYGGLDDGGHDVVGANSPATAWSFAEGYTGPGFDEYITVQNPNAFSTTVTTTYQFKVGAPKATILSVPANSRRTISVHATSEAGRNQEVSAKLTSTLPIVAERPMYFGYNLAATGTTVTGGHDTLGSTSSSQAYYFASGETTTFFDEYLTIQNANASKATATILYMRDDGSLQSKKYSLPANSRTTAVVFNDVGRGKQMAAAVFADQPIVVERPTYFQNGSPGVTVTGGGDVIGAHG